MCTTPAPPSTALVAASIWSGTGDVNTSPGQAASSIPRPTKPPCSGSWPDPPPETRPTFPATGASFRSTTWFSKSTRTRSECAAPRPASDSLTTSSGALTNFFIVCVATLTVSSFLPRCDRRRKVCAIGFCDGLLDRALDLARRRHPVVVETRESGADQVAGDVGEELLCPV